MEYTLSVNGLEVAATFEEKDIEGFYLPLLRLLTRMKENRKVKLIVFLAAPPGCGKTTLSYFLQYLSENSEELIPLQAAGIDGFMYKKNVIKDMTIEIDGKTQPLAIYKGCPESFNVDALRNKLRIIRSGNITWPLYSRQIHDSVDDVITIDRDIVLIEGNYLLYNEGNWKDIHNYCDLSLFIHNDVSKLADRLINRKKMGGSSDSEAVTHYETSDKRNVETVMAHHYEPDIDVVLDGSTITSITSKIEL